MTKHELEVKVNDLELTLNAVEANAKNLKDDLATAQRALENVNKPEITEVTLNDIREAVQYVLENHDFNCADHYDYDFEINYDNRIEITNIEYNNIDDIAENITIDIEGLFNVVD